MSDRSFQTRFNQDTNTNQTETYAQYMTEGTGNGRTILVVPVNDPVQSSIDGAAYIIGFAAFFLQNDFASLLREYRCFVR